MLTIAALQQCLLKNFFGNLELQFQHTGRDNLIRSESL